MKDSASDLTLQVFDALEDLLHVDRVAEGLPTFTPSLVSPISIARAQEALKDLYTGTTLYRALAAMEAYPEVTDSVQTSGVGFAPDFDVFVKMGLLMGSRVVLWDAVLSGILSAPPHEVDLDQLGAMVCQLLLLKPLAEDGGVVFLPHPAVWCERYRYLTSAALRGRRLSTELHNQLLGLLNARALEDEGIEVHPYMFLDPERGYLHRAIMADSKMFSAAEADRQESLIALLSDQRFVFAQDISAAEFYRLRATPAFKDLPAHLRNLFHYPPGLSPRQQREHRRLALDQVARHIQEMNEQVHRAAKLRGGSRAAFAGSALGLVGATLAFSGGAAGTAGLCALGGGLLAALGDALPVLLAGKRPSDQPVVQQFFWELSRGGLPESH